MDKLNQQQIDYNLTSENGIDMKVPFLLLFLIIFSIAIITHVLGFSIRESLLGDEFHTLVIAKSDQNIFNGFFYFYLFKKWLNISDKDAWLRLFSLLFSMLAIPVFYVLSKRMLASRRAAVATLLFVISPYIMQYSSMVRFYSFFLFWSLCSYLFLYLYSQTKIKKYLALLLMSNVALSLSHMFGVYVVILEAVYWWIVHKKEKLFYRLLGFMIFSFLMSILLAAFPGVKKYGWDLLQSSVRAVTYHAFDNSQGFRLIHLAKAPLLYYLFAFGFYINPLQPLILFYETCVLVMCIFSGKHIYAQAERSVFYFLFLVYTPLMFYGVMESLSPPRAGITPQHLIFVAPLFYLFLAEGLPRLQAKKCYIFGSLLAIIFLTGVYYTVRPSWAYMRSDLIDWRRAAKAIIGSGYTPQIIVCDGRSQDPVRRYFRFGLPVKLQNDFVTAKDYSAYSRLILVTNDSEHARKKNKALEEFNDLFAYRLIYSNYPATVSYLFKKYPNSGGARQNLLPLQLWPMTFQDIIFPIPITYAGQDYVIEGVASLDGGAKKLNMEFAAEPLKGITIFSNTIYAIAKCSVIAEIRFFSGTELRYQTSIIQDVDTFDWFQKGKNNSAVYHWHKQIALVEKIRGPGIWEDGLASVYAAYVKLPQAMPVDRIEITLKDKGILNIFGVFPDER